MDLLNESIRLRTDLPHDGTVAELLECIVESAHEGNKSKALVYLEALEACWRLQQRGLDLQQLPAKALAERLFIAARAAQNHRDYFPTNSVHIKIVSILDRGISFDDEAFPKEFFAQFVDGTKDATSDDQRRNLERYIFMLDRLTKSGANLEQPARSQIVHALRRELAAGRDQLSALAQRIEQLLPLDGSVRDPTLQSRDLTALAHELAVP